MQTLAFIACNALALSAAWGLARALLPGEEFFPRIVATIAGLPAVVIPTLTLLGVVGLLTPAAAGAALALETVGLHGFANRQASPPVRVPESGKMGVQSLVAGAILGLLALQVASFVHLLLLSGWHPHWDDLSYHAPMAAHWLQAERLVLAPYHYHAYYPGNGELFAAWFMLATKLDGYASLSGAYSMLLCGLSVALSCRRLGCDLSSALLGAVALMLCRPFWQHAGTFAAVDLVGTSAVCAAIALSLPGPTDLTRDASRGRAWFVGALLGVAIGCKITFAPLAGLVFGYLLLERRPTASEAARLAALFAVAASLAGNFYYVRNFLLTGNPLFPAAVLGFEGPLDEAARRPTSLVYQLRAIDRTQLVAACKELLDWPRPVGYALLAAYGATFVASSRWPSWKQPIARMRLFLLLAGLLSFWVSAAGPFSGTANAPFAQLQVRLRFFLPGAAIGIPLAAHWLHRVGRGTPWAAAAGALAACSISVHPWPTLLAFVAAGIAVMAGSTSAVITPLWRPRVTCVTALTLLLLGPAAAAWAMSYKQPQNDRAMRNVVPAWNVVDNVPAGSRVAWFATFEGYKYYRAFGHALTVVPVAVNGDGTQTAFLHEYWREYNPTWWVNKKRPSDPKKLMHNLRAQRIDYVVVMKRHGGPWPSQREILLRAKRVRAIAKRENVTLFEISRVRGRKSQNHAP